MQKHALLSVSQCHAAARLADAPSTTQQAWIICKPIVLCLDDLLSPCSEGSHAKTAQLTVSVSLENTGLWSETCKLALEY